MMQLADVGLVQVRNTFPYMSFGLPILSSLNGIFGESVKKDRIGLTYRQDDAADLSRNICRLIDNPCERKDMGTNARRLHEKRFTVDKVYGGFAEHLKTIIRRIT
ncbi:glycosyltransferase [Verrucomicrobia bacterium]|nr:glycosyltransferase [Verrucomicrobiota bacterium]